MALRSGGAVARTISHIAGATLLSTWTSNRSGAELLEMAGLRLPALRMTRFRLGRQRIKFSIRNNYLQLALGPIDGL